MFQFTHQGLFFVSSDLGFGNPRRYNKKKTSEKNKQPEHRLESTVVHLISEMFYFIAYSSQDFDETLKKKNPRYCFPPSKASTQQQGSQEREI